MTSILVSAPLSEFYASAILNTITFNMSCPGQCKDGNPQAVPPARWIPSLLAGIAKKTGGHSLLGSSLVRAKTLCRR